MKRKLFILCMMFAQMQMLAQHATNTDVPELPGIVFNKNSTKLTKANKQTLDSILQIAKQYPELSIVISCGFTCNPKQSPLGWYRMEQVFKYFIQKGADSAKIVAGTHNAQMSLISFQLEEVERNPIDLPHPDLLKREANKTGLYAFYIISCSILPKL